MITSGDLKEKVDLMEKVQSGPVVNLNPQYALVKEGIRAKKTKLLGKESIILNATENLVPVHFIMRKRTLTEGQFLKCRGKMYDITGFEDLRENDMYMLVATMEVRND